MLLRRLASKLPAHAQDLLKALRFRHQIRNHQFIPNEPEIAFIWQNVRQGDWVIDVGANVGHYTYPLAKAAGPTGRVLAFEPIARTHALLAMNAVCWATGNVTLINAAASDRLSIAGMSVPKFHGGSDNFYMAQLTPSGDSPVVCLPIDCLDLPRVGLIKIDAEGHDLAVLRGARALISRDHPAIIIEADLDSAVADWLRDAGYRLTCAPESPNLTGTWDTRLARRGVPMAVAS
jgi:FkbM family methyltransferase